MNPTKTTRPALAAAIIAIATSACSHIDSTPAGAADRRNAQHVHQGLNDGKYIQQSIHAATDRLVAHLGMQPGPAEQVVVTTISNLSRLESTSALGRTISETIASQIVQHGYHVGELRLRNEMIIQDHTGEFILTRKARDIAQSQDATAVITGTYSATPFQVFVNLRLIRLNDNKILGASDFVLPMTHSTRALLGQTTASTTLRLEEK